MKLEFDNLEDGFKSKAFIEHCLNDLLNTIKKETKIIYYSDLIDNNFEYVKNKLNEINYSIKKIGKDKLTNYGKYLIKKQ